MNLASPASGGWRWMQPQTEPGYHELRTGDGSVAGTLRFLPKPAVAWGYTNRRQAHAEIGGRRWDFWIERKGLSGLLGTAATVQITGTDTGTVAAGAFFVRGTLELAGGRRAQWSGGPTRGGPPEFQDEHDRTLVRFETGSIFDRVNAYVVADPGAGSADWPLLVALGLYLRLAMNKVFR